MYFLLTRIVHGKGFHGLKVLEEKLDIAKVDCEGCEDSLLNLSDDYQKSGKISYRVLQNTDLAWWEIFKGRIYSNI